MDDEGKEYPLARLGLGMGRLLAIAFGLHFAKGQRLLLDEVETGLHYETQEKVWAWIFESSKKLDVQVFAATHSLDCVRAFSKVADESGEVGILYRLDRKFGPIRVVAYDERKLRIASEQDIEVR